MTLAGCRQEIGTSSLASYPSADVSKPGSTNVLEEPKSANAFGLTHVGQAGLTDDVTIAVPTAFNPGETLDIHTYGTFDWLIAGIDRKEGIALIHFDDGSIVQSSQQAAFCCLDAAKNKGKQTLKASCTTGVLQVKTLAGDGTVTVWVGTKAEKETSLFVEYKGKIKQIYVQGPQMVEVYYNSSTDEQMTIRLGDDGGFYAAAIAADMGLRICDPVDLLHGESFDLTQFGISGWRLASADQMKGGREIVEENGSTVYKPIGAPTFTYTNGQNGSVEQPKTGIVSKGGKLQFHVTKGQGTLSVWAYGENNGRMTLTNGQETRTIPIDGNRLVNIVYDIAVDATVHIHFSEEAGWYAAAQTDNAITRDGEQLRSLIFASYGSSQRVIVPPGRYTISPAKGSKAHLAFFSMNNYQIIADGVVLACQTIKRAIDISYCENLTLRGFTVDYEPLCFTQGKVLAVAEDRRSFTMQVDDGYPESADYKRLRVLDPKTEYLKDGMPNFFWNTTTELLENRMLKVSMSGRFDSLEVGDLVTLGVENYSHTIEFSYSSGLKLLDMTILTGPGFGFHEWKCNGGNELWNCRVTPGPMPEGAQQPRLLSTTADAFNSAFSSTGFSVQNGLIERAGDDVCAVSGVSAFVCNQSGDTVTMAVPYLDDGGGKYTWKTGDRIRIIAADGSLLGESVLDTIESTLFDGTVPNSVAKNYYAVKFSESVNLEYGMYLANLDRCSADYRFENNIVYSNGRIYSLTSKGTVTGNVIKGTMGAVVAGPSYYDMLINYTDDLIITNNVFQRTGYVLNCSWWGECASIYIGTSNKTPYRGNKNITIENNSFWNNQGLNIVALCAENVLIKNNIFRETHQEVPYITGRDAGFQQSSLIWAEKSSRVDLTGNRAEMGPYCASIVTVTDDCETVIGMLDGVTEG